MLRSLVAINSQWSSIMLDSRLSRAEISSYKDSCFQLIIPRASSDHHGLTDSKVVHSNWPGNPPVSLRTRYKRMRQTASDDFNHLPDLKLEGKHVFIRRDTDQLPEELLCKYWIPAPPQSLKTRIRLRAYQLSTALTYLGNYTVFMKKQFFFAMNSDRW